MNLNLVRDTETEECTLGTMQVGDAVYQTIEQPNNHDQPGHSCVPCATYQLVPHISGHLHEVDGVTPLQTWALVNPAVGIFHAPSDVPADYEGEYPARKECLIHPANWAFQLEGCIAPGLFRKQSSQGMMVTSSRDTFNDIREALGGAGTTGHTLTIVDGAE